MRRRHCKHASQLAMIFILQQPSHFLVKKLPLFGKITIAQPHVFAKYKALSGKVDYSKFLVALNLQKAVLPL